MADQVQTVQIKTTDINRYSTIIRACVTAGNAAASLNEIEIAAQLEVILDWAMQSRNSAINSKLSNAPARG